MQDAQAGNGGTVMVKKTEGDNVMALPMKIKGVPEAGSITPAQIMEQVLIKGDLKNLNEEERARYYTRVCDSVGLNPLTQPFQYITLNGKLTLYANKDCAAQLRKLHDISVDSIDLEEISGVYLFKAKLRAKDGRCDVGTGAVSVKGLTGEALANQIMKGETKAKRRGTLSICGLGFLDETEIEDMPAERKSSAESKRDGTVKLFNEIRRLISCAPDCAALSSLMKDQSRELDAMPERWLKVISDDFIDKWQDLGGSLDDCPMLPMEERG
jgi:hypothetical protein